MYSPSTLSEQETVEGRDSQAADAFRGLERPIGAALFSHSA